VFIATFIDVGAKADAGHFNISSFKEDNNNAEVDSMVGNAGKCIGRDKLGEPSEVSH